MKQDEAKLQGAAVTYLRTALPSRAIVFAVPNGGSRDKREAARLKWQGVLAGVPDILVMLDGKTLGIEFKSAKGKLSDAQEGIADKFTANGFPWTVARSLDDVEHFARANDLPVKARVA